MKTEEMDRIADESEHPMLRMDGFDHCCIGVGSRFGMEDVFCYSKEKVVKDLQYHGFMSEEEAEDYFSFNILGSYMGEGTPCFITEMEG